jgi:CHAT domain-containing protein
MQYAKVVLIFLLCFPFALSYAQPAVKDSSQAKLLFEEGKQLAKSSQSEQALKKLEAASNIYKDLKLWEEYFEVENIICKTLWRTGNTDLALQKATNLLPICRKELGKGKHLQEAVLLENIAIAYGIKRYNYLSMRYFEQCLRLRRKLLGDEDPAQGQIANNLGIAKRNEGHYDEAIDYLHEAINWKIKKYGENHEKLIRSYNVMSTIYILKHEYEHGHEYAQKALDISKNTYGEKDPRTADSYSRLGIAYHYEGETKKALEYLEKARQLMSDIYSPEHAYLIAIHNNIGEAELEDGDYEAARENFEKALQISIKEVGEQDAKTIAIYNNIGEVYHRQNKAEKALEYFQIALESHISLVGQAHPTLANIYNLLGQQYFDIQEYDKSLEAYQHAIMANIYHFNDSSLYSNPVWTEDLHYAEGNILISSLLHKGLAADAIYQQEHKKEDLQNAYEALMTALKIVEATEHSYTHKKDKAILLKTEQNVYRTAIELCLAQYEISQDINFLEEAFEISERDKSVLLMENLHQEDALKFGGIPDSLIRKEKHLRLDLATYKKKLSDAKTSQNAEKIKYYEDILFELNQEEDALLAQFEEDYPKYHRLKYQNTSSDIKTIQEEILDEETALLEYFLMDSLVFLFVIESNAYHLERIAFADLEDQLQTFRSVLAKVSFKDQNFEQDFNRFTKSSKLFYDQLIAPAKLSEKVNKLIIVADGLLNHIPFEVLIRELPNANQKSYKTLPYLLKDYAISYSFSAALRIEAKANPIKAPNHQILAMAPSYDSQNDHQEAINRSQELQRMRAILEDLPGAKAEVNLLSQRFKGIFSFAKEANEGSFHQQANQYGIIHLAMHGKLNVKSPIASALVFSENGDSTHDNLLYAYEINDLDLNAELIVLSACETGYGKFQDGEGVMSLARSFMYAGTHSLLMTLWTVSDASTQVLMDYFYQNLAAGMSKDEALRQAKLRYLDQASDLAAHPFLWAGFVVLGDPQPIKIETKGSGALGWIIGLSGIFVIAIGIFWARKMAKAA